MQTGLIGRVGKVISSSGGGGGGGIPANAIRQRDNDPIKDRAGAFIEVRS